MLKTALVLFLALPAIAAAQDAPPDPNAAADRIEDQLQVLSRGTSTLRADVNESYLRLARIRMDLYEHVDGSRISITHQNAVGPLYRLVEVTYAIDGESVFHQRDESGALGRSAELDVHDGTIAPGEHRLSVVLRYVGDGGELVRYLSGYRFVVRSSQSFAALPGQHTRLSVRTFERSIDVPYEERLGIVYDRMTGPWNLHRDE